MPEMNTEAYNTNLDTADYASVRRRTGRWSTDMPTLALGKERSRPHGDFIRNRSGIVERQGPTLSCKLVNDGAG